VFVLTSSFQQRTRSLPPYRSKLIPYLQILGKLEKNVMDKQSSLFQRSNTDEDKSFIILADGAGTKKCFTAVVDSKKLECLSLSVTVSID
jgi:hypothetical protein